MQRLRDGQNSLLFSSPSKMGHKNIVCRHRLLRIIGNIGPILFVLYTADAENNRCAWPSSPLLQTRYTALLLHFRVDDVQLTQAQSIQV